MRAGLAAVLTCLTVIAAPIASPAQDRELRWKHAPTSEELDRFYPVRAREQDVEGRGVVRCAVTPEGALTSCVVLEEAPVGAGFGQATLQATSVMRIDMSPGGPVPGDTVVVPITWSLSEPPPNIWWAIRGIYAPQGKRCRGLVQSDRFDFSETGITFPDGTFGRVTSGDVVVPANLTYDLSMPGGEIRNVVITLEPQGRFITLSYDGTSVVMTNCTRPKF